MRFVSVLLACSLICPVSPSRCPEPKKPHLTSCTIFYNCVNLPSGGYVWVPSKCNAGLVFQPYLRMCVVPGDIWTCDILSTDSPVTKKHEISELINPMDTSYLGYTEDPLGFSETIDSSFVIDNFSDSTIDTMTAYPLIEFEESDKTTHNDKSVRNASYHREENYLYKYTNSQGQLSLSLVQEYKDIVNNHYKWLNKLMSRLHVYKELSAAISSSLSIPVRDSTTVNPTQTITIFASYNRRQNVSLNYLVQSYTEGNELPNSNDEPTEMIESNKPQINSIATTDSTVSTENALELLIDSLDSDNSIIRISDNLGNRQYFTIDRYKNMAHRLTPRTISVVTCTRNVRLPNKTDCYRYYTCEPKTATVVEYSCPLHTAFNVYSRICDVESVKTCGSNVKLPVNEIFFENIHANDKSTIYEGESGERLCKELGKIKDPVSDSHYYICYSVPDSEGIKSIRMTCPNALIFCQSKKVCTTRRLCDGLS
ncbi:hypothetical protein ALC60_00201 [Trachymyrmex zeteki]|uniref:Chitin-binding type-2 domain-containing protein n=1 Tax=Mycetomoellerius zeteki TaxID=64791 RepID=A0A151XK22_9HYME|nr:PREDICTED: uncharacterized protein LOC108731567 [Trachymyrmex zeteki]KYQ60754.1 hypothetical protein ALC60_00201 [Trachymyrmex zeteki]